MFAAFRELHLSFRDELAGDEGFIALCRFLERWDPGRAESLPNWEEAAGLNVVFKLRAREGYIHQSDPVRAAWLRHTAAQGERSRRVRGVSLVSGEEEELARLHPQISGVVGANTIGRGHRLVQPRRLRELRQVAELQRPGRHARRLPLHDRPQPPARRRPRDGSASATRRSSSGRIGRGGGRRRDLPPNLRRRRSAGRAAEHAATVDRVRAFLDAARQGRLGGPVSEDPDAPFYVLGLSPNASRLTSATGSRAPCANSPNVWPTHVEHLEMTGARPEDPPLVIRRLLLETAREPKDIAPQLAGEVARAVLGGLPYPQIFFNAVVRRIRADSTMNHRRAAILKAYLIRNREKEVPVALNKDHPDEAYQLRTAVRRLGEDPGRRD